MRIKYCKNIPSIVSLFMRVLVVESPAKSKTIGKYLGKGFIVIPSYGHIRDLPSKNNSVDPKDGFSMKWELSKTGSEFVDKLKKVLPTADELLLATDPDREGEAISWHITECIKDMTKSPPIKRVAFHEITKHAILEAIKTPRAVDINLVNAYLARRALDYLYGFTLSPLLWRRLPGCKSAGRVQSVALRILVDRENEIEAFKSQEYWSVSAECIAKSSKFLSHLIKLDGKKIAKLTLKDAHAAESAKNTILNCQFNVASLDKKTVNQSPHPPFITSTLQQDASRKLGFSSKKTIQLAQQLYEGVDIDGERKALITYMRTDSVNLSSECISSVRKIIEKLYGKDYLPNTPKYYKNKVKNAQEAHEAIRPTDVEINPNDLAGKIDTNLLKLYTLIWKRTIACQMNNAQISRVQLILSDTDKLHELKATGSTLIFEGYMRAYEVVEDKSENEDNQKIPELEVGTPVKINDVKAEQHFTQPPARYTEASLIKKMEELGIGRPSTYATVIQVLQDRKYAIINKKAFSAELKGRFVVSFLKQYFPKYVEYDFTANMEEDLDNISNAVMQWDVVLNNFWNGLSTNAKDVDKTTMLEVVNLLTRDLSKVIFGDKEEDKKCPKCGADLVLKLWSTAAYVGCSQYPDCDYKRSITSNNDEGQNGVPLSDFPKVLGTDPKTGKDVVIKSGPYGPYIELQTDIKKRVSVPKGINPLDVPLGQALDFLSLPKVIGQLDGNDISIGNGRFGPYIACNKKYYSVKTFDELFTITLEQAIERINMGKK